MPEVTIEQAMQTAGQLENSGKGAEAEQIYRQILAMQGNHFDALNRLGLMAARSGRYDAAIDCFRRMAGRTSKLVLFRLRPEALALSLPETVAVFAADHYKPPNFPPLAKQAG